MEEKTNDQKDSRGPSGCQRPDDGAGCGRHLHPSGGVNLVSTVSAEDIQSENQVQWQETANGAWQTGTFEEAISKVYDGGQIVLLSDISLTQTVTISKSVTISSKNQNKITCQVNQHEYLLNITS